MKKRKIPSASPYIRSNANTSKIMLYVLLALAPSALAGVLNFGFSALLLLGTTTGTAIAAEIIFRTVTGKRQTVQDLSAAVTGLLIGMTLPPDIPLWKAGVGSVFAIVIVKQLFGGIGQNFANPAATAKIFLLVLFMNDMTKWRLPQTAQTVDLTPLTGAHASYFDMLLGNTAGCVGETCAIGLILGALFLYLTGTASPFAPIGCLGSFAVLTLAGGYDLPAQLLSGGLMLGACFMTTDYTTAPLTHPGQLLFGIGVGVLTFLIRHYGGFAEGIPFAIVMMNLLTPWLDRLTKPRPFGAETEEKPVREKPKRKFLSRKAS